MRAGEAIPQVVRHLLHADLVRGATQVEEAEVHAAAAAHQHVAGHARVETAGNQRHYVFLSADRVTADAFETAFDQHQLVVFDLRVYRNLRAGQVNASAFDVLVQAAADVALHVLRVERLLAAALDAHAEGFAFQLGAVGFQRLLEDVVDVGISAIFHLQNMVDAGNARQGIGDDRPLVFIFGANFDMIPVTDDRQRFIILLQDVANIGRENLDKAQAHRLALDGDFREQFNDKLHGGLCCQIRITARSISPYRRALRTKPHMSAMIC